MTTALITGASNGIGGELAGLLAANAARLIRARKSGVAIHRLRSGGLPS